MFIIKFFLLQYMGDTRKILSFTIISAILLTGLVGLSEQAFADKNDKTNSTKIIHLGYLQLAAHDFFDVNRSEMSDNENGLLDLSTVLFNPHTGDCDFEKSLDEDGICELYDDEDIAIGGEKRSFENIMISTASAEVGEKYLHYAGLIGEEKAYKNTLKFYHKQIEKAYEQSFDLKFPDPREGQVTQLHNLALRAGHDFLPAEIVYDGELTSIFEINPLGERLSEQEQSQPGSPIDGMFDVEYLNIVLFCPAPGFCITVNLLEADQTFGTLFGLDNNAPTLKFDEFMTSLKDGKFDSSDEVSILLDDAFAFGINLD
jgi:hypothetical protein